MDLFGYSVNDPIVCFSCFLRKELSITKSAWHSYSLHIIMYIFGYKIIIITHYSGGSSSHFLFTGASSLFGLGSLGNYWSEI